MFVSSVVTLWRSTRFIATFCVNWVLFQCLFMRKWELTNRVHWMLANTASARYFVSKTKFDSKNKRIIFSIFRVIITAEAGADDANNNEYFTRNVNKEDAWVARIDTNMHVARVTCNVDSKRTLPNTQKKSGINKSLVFKKIKICIWEGFLRNGILKVVLDRNRST